MPSPRAKQQNITRVSGEKRRGRKDRSMVKLIQRVIHNNMEKKCYITYGANTALNVIGVAGSTLGNNALYLLPVISQGTGHGLRIGNEIKIRKAVVRGHVNILPYQSVSNPLSTPVYVKMWLCAFKTINTALINNTAYANFFETGAGSASFQGNMLDMVLSNNRDIVTVYKTKKFKLGASYASSTGAVGTSGYFDNSRMNVPFTFSYGKYFKGALKYNDTATNVPENRNCWLICQVVMADGSTATFQPAEWHYNVRVEFEDA